VPAHAHSACDSRNGVVAIAPASCRLAKQEPNQFCASGGNGRTAVSTGGKSRQAGSAWVGSVQRMHQKGATLYLVGWQGSAARRLAVQQIVDPVTGILGGLFEGLGALGEFFRGAGAT